MRPLEIRLKHLGFRLDADIANAEVGTWLREVLNVRIHGVTKERPLTGLHKSNRYFFAGPRGGVRRASRRSSI